MINKDIKSIKESPSWNDYQDFVNEEIAKLEDIQKINGEIQLEANKKAVKVIRDILFLINN